MAVHYVIVEGLRLPAKLGGHPVLDFCNTLAGWDGHEAKDYLQSYDHVAQFAGLVGLLPADRVALLRRQAHRPAGAADELVDQARELRAHLYAVLRKGPSADAFELVAEDIHAAAASVRLARAEQTFRWETGRDVGLAAPLVAVAWSAGQLLTSPDLERVRVCPGTGCGWLFLDRSGRRRWCTMATCGNREKVRRFAARAREAPRGG